jgi:hypothetical protein
VNFKPFFVNEQNRYIWLRDPRWHYAGFTAYVEPVHGEPRTIAVRVAMCSKHDAFCKRVGRIECMSKEPVHINARDLEDFLEVYHADVYGHKYHFFEKQKNRSGKFTHLFRYML